MGRPSVYIMVYETDAAQWERFNNRGQGRWDWYPMADHWTWGDRKQARLTTFTNAEEVELILNGRSLGRQRLADCRGRIMDWDLPYEPGTVEAVARNGGNIVARHTLTTAGPATALHLTPHRKQLAADGLDVVCVEAALMDAHGGRVPDHGRRITFSVEGPAHNAGVANGDSVSDEPWQAPSRSTWYGRCILLVRAGTETGTVTLTAAADGIPPAALDLPVTSPAGRRASRR